jgi:hypothetical protein
MSFEAENSVSHATGHLDSAPMSGAHSGSTSALPRPSRSVNVPVDDDEDSILDEVSAHCRLFMPLPALDANLCQLSMLI